jgi:inosine-uridine nucleoside N-ribohydrolase
MRGALCALLAATAAAAAAAAAAPAAPAATAAAAGRRALWVDADTAGLVAGGLDLDDDLALLALLGDATLHVVGVSATFGNADLEATSADARRILERSAGGAAAFASGVSWAQRGEGVLQELARGATPSRSDDEYTRGDSRGNAAAEVLVATLRARPIRTVTVLCLGPLTTLADAIALDAAAVARAERLVFMGGDLANNWADLDLNWIVAAPAAARRALLLSDVPTLVVPVQTCLQAAVTSAELARAEAQCCSTRARPRSTPLCALLAKARLSVGENAPPVLNELFHSPRYPLRSARERDGFVPWDVVAAALISDAPLFGNFSVVAIDAVGPLATRSRILSHSHASSDDAFAAARQLRSTEDGRARALVVAPLRVLDERELLRRAFDRMCAASLPEDAAWGDAVEGVPPLQLGRLLLAEPSSFAFHVASLLLMLAAALAPWRAVLVAVAAAATLRAAMARSTPS